MHGMYCGLSSVYCNSRIHYTRVMTTCIYHLCSVCMSVNDLFLFVCCFVVLINQVTSNWIKDGWE